MENNWLDYRDNEDERRQVQTSHLKYHFILRGLSVTQNSINELENKLFRELEHKFNIQIQCESFKVVDIGKGKHEILVGLRYDKQAEKIKGTEIDLRSNGITRLDPTEAFQALIEYRTRRQPIKTIRRSRSPKTISPMLLILCPPKGVTDKDIQSELIRLGLEEIPNIEYIFSNLYDIGGGLIIKLSFQHIRTIEQLCKAEFSLKNKAVLLLEPSLKHDIEKSVKHAIIHHQILIDNEQDFSVEDITNPLLEIGRVCQIDKRKNKFLVTFTQLRSAKQALRAEFITVRDHKLVITKYQI
ncbi:hypothetical protein SteCoe_36458 [Stentor coeruleus]|uniref:Uncharacterized protein n=1 Tax=Stentor coeruleus TaxID=5963 RepID=A0A1R2AQB2_9CILI|nr:hypothetical protein SteCoe_36458 [Stentor coeruleus]